MNTIYFQPPDIKPEYVEIGIIHESDKSHIWYLNEPCKVAINEVKIISDEYVYFDKKSKSYKIKNTNL